MRKNAVRKNAVMKTGKKIRMKMLYNLKTVIR